MLCLLCTLCLIVPVKAEELKLTPSAILMKFMGLGYIMNLNSVVTREQAEMLCLELNIEYELQKLMNYKHANRLISEYIEGFYNTVRIHSHCNYESPVQYEKQYCLNVTT